MGDESKAPTGLPSDIIMFEVLARAPCATVARCRIICKEWNEFTYCSVFKDFHHRRTKTLSGFITQRLHHNDYTPMFGSTHEFKNSFPLKFLQTPNNNVKVEASAECGLVLCQTNGFRHRIPRFYICKLSTEQCTQLPNPKTRYFTVKMAMTVLQANPLQFKIVRLSRPHPRNYSKFSNVGSLVCETFDSKTWRWKRLKDVILGWEELLERDCGTSVGGAHHWLLWTRQVLAFSQNEESWIKFPTPDNGDTGTSLDRGRLVEYSGKLGFFRVIDENIYLWVMKDIKTRSWTQCLTVNMEAPRSVYRYCQPLMFYGSQVLILSGFYALIYYNFKTRKCDVVEFEDRFDASYFFSIWSDFEPYNLEIPQTSTTRARISTAIHEPHSQKLYPRFGANRFEMITIHFSHHPDYYFYADLIILILMFIGSLVLSLVNRWLGM